MLYASLCVRALMRRWIDLSVHTLEPTCVEYLDDRVGTARRQKRHRGCGRARCERKSSLVVLSAMCRDVVQQLECADIPDSHGAVVAT